MDYEKITLIVCSFAAFISVITLIHILLQNSSAKLSGHRLQDSAGDNLWIRNTGSAQARNITITLDDIPLADITIFDGRKRTILGPDGVHIYDLQPAHATKNDIVDYEKRFPSRIKITWDDDISDSWIWRWFRKPRSPEYVGHL